MRTVKIISKRVFKAGYVLRRELIESPAKENRRQIWTMAYTPSGYYIGNSKDAYRLCVKRGIQPEPVSDSGSVCCIGFSVKDGKWYGWSNRAIYGFRIGSTCRKGDCHYIPKRHKGKGKWTAKTVADAKRMACDFAEGVS